MIKTLSFAVVHMTVAFTVVGLLTGNWMAGGVVALVEPMCNTVAYHFHEKVWVRLRERGVAIPELRAPQWLRSLGHAH